MATSSCSRPPSNAIFVWVPKTGGTSLKTVLDITMMKRVADVQPAKLKGLVTFGHLDCNMLVSRGILPRPFFYRARKFMFVRDPYDRAVSLYHRVRLPKETFEGCLKRIWRAQPVPGLLNQRGLSMCSPQAYWLCPETAIFRFEDFAGEVARLAEFLGRPPVYVPNANPTGQPRPPLTERARRLIEAIYAVDFDVFGYAKVSDALPLANQH